MQPTVRQRPADTNCVPPGDGTTSSGVCQQLQLGHSALVPQPGRENLHCSCSATHPQSLPASESTTQTVLWLQTDKEEKKKVVSRKHLH